MILTKIAVLLLFLYLGCCTIKITVPSQPPPPNEAAKMARYIMHNTAWISIGTTSTTEDIQGYPFVSLESVSDGSETNSTGIPYLYLTHLESAGQDLLNDSRCTIMASLAEGDYCLQNNYDPQDPRCARLFITGKMVKLEKDNPEFKFGQDALFLKHPVMRTWPIDHGFFVAKIDIQKIALFNSFGGMKIIPIEDYFKADNNKLTNDILLNDVAFVEIIL